MSNVSRFYSYYSLQNETRSSVKVQRAENNPTTCTGFCTNYSRKVKKKRPFTAAPLTSPPPSGTFVCLEKIWEQAPTFEKE